MSLQVSMTYMSSDLPEPKEHRGGSTSCRQPRRPMIPMRVRAKVI